MPDAVKDAVVRGYHGTESGGPAYRFVYVDQAGFEAHRPQDFMGLQLAFGTIRIEKGSRTDYHCILHASNATKRNL